MDDREQRRWIERIFHGALECDESARAEYISRECAGDDDLRKRIERLLDSDAHTSPADGAPGSPDGEPTLTQHEMIGAIISHYRIDAELGRGGMGTVFRAYDTHLRRPVALKMLTGSVTSVGGAGSAVLAEARAASALNHPSIITIYEVGEYNGQHFIVMELLSGTNLRSIIQKGSVEPATVFRIGTQIAEALHAAHSEGVIHGDVKPENVMVLPTGHVKLLDFGIARRFGLTTQTAELHALGASGPPDHFFAGTPAYAAPEALCLSHIDSRSDLYSLGVLLYELVEGSRPFRATSPAALVDQVLHQPAPDLKVSPAGLGNRLGEVVNRLLAKEPDARYQSAQEVQIELVLAEREFEIGPVVSSAQAGKQSIAVLPFRLLTPDPPSEFLCVALADAVINQLGARGEIIVRPTNSVLRYAGRITDPLLAARELNTDICVEGSIQKVGSRIRVHVQVWETGSRRSLSSAKYDGDDTELFQLQDSMADGIASVLGLAVPSAAGQLPPTDNPIAYELFLRAVDCLSRINRWEVRSAITMLEEATRLDLHFADAWAQLAEACMRMFTLFEPDEHWLKQAERAVRRCLIVDPGNADGYCVLARIQWSPPHFQIRKALRSITTAVRLNPGCRQAHHWHGMYLFHVGLHEDANREITAALAANPDDPLALFGIGHIALYSGDYDTAYKYHSRALATDPSNFYASILFPGVPLYAGDLDEAEERIRIARQVAPEDSVGSSWEALLFAKRGDIKRAEAAARKAARSKQLFTYSHHLAHAVGAAYAILGKTDSALTWLRRASETGFPNYPVFRDDPHLTGLGEIPEYRRFLSAMKRQWVAFNREFAHAGDVRRAVKAS
jgi:serine/threonine-protein kinase